MTQPNPKADSQSPAEALSFELQNILRPITIMMYMPPTTPPTVQEALKLEAAIEKEITEAVTAYAATVEREAPSWISREDVKEAYQIAGLMSSYDQAIDVLWREINERLAALQGPQDGDAE